jgi:hypothetical protein
LDHLKPHKSVEQIAKKHRLDVSFVQKQLEMGIPIEHEHTKDKVLATDIALQHLDEIPDYYTRLKKMEASAKKEHKKFKDVKEQKSEMRYCGLCRKEESQEDCKYGADMWNKYTRPQQILTQNQMKYDTNRPHPANEQYENVTIEDANGNTFLQIIDIIRADRLVKEGKKMKGEDPCWKGYEMIGKKKNGGKEVPNCVPVKEGISFDVGKPSRGAGALTPSAAAQLGPKAVDLQKKKAAAVSLPSTAGVKLADSYKLKSFSKFMAEASPAWQRKEGKNPEGGLNKKGISSYRKEHPGSHLSLAVTTKPSELKKGSKSANRRKSFCSRMSGMKAKLTSAKTANDPNSRINKSLRKWNC